MIDLLVKALAVITMDDSHRVITDGEVGIDQGKIVQIGSNVGIPAKKVIDAKNCVIMPGLINGHSHVYQSLIEGIGYDMHFDPWNWRFLFPIVSKMSPDHARISAELAAIEMIKTGTTTISDHWYMHTDLRNIYEVTDAFDKAGMRAQMVYGLLDQTFAGERIESEYMTMIKTDEQLIQQVRNYYQEWHGKRRTTMALGPGSTEDISDELMLKTRDLSRELDINVSTHVAGWIEINAYTQRKFGERDLEHLHTIGLTGPRGVFFHAVWLSNHEIEILAATGSKVIHCPMANAYLGYGIAPVAQMLERGIPVGLGTDGAASYTYDLWEVGRAAAMLQKATHLDGEAITAEQILSMMTINGATALGLQQQVGSLEIGKQADLIAVNFDREHLLPDGRFVPKLVYSAHGSDVVHSIIDGQVVMEDRELKTMQENTIREKAFAARQDLIKIAGQETRDLMAAPWPEHGAYWRVVAQQGKDE